MSLSPLLLSRISFQVWGKKNPEQKIGKGFVSKRYGGGVPSVYDGGEVPKCLELPRDDWVKQTY